MKQVGAGGIGQDTKSNLSRQGATKVKDGDCEICPIPVECEQKELMRFEIGRGGEK